MLYLTDDFQLLKKLPRKFLLRSLNNVLRATFAPNIHTSNIRDQTITWLIETIHN